MKHISFQLTASRRGWLFFLMKQLIWLTFQLTASRRGWPGLRFFCRTSWYFNSQPHEEADEVIRFKQITGLISTHSLTKRLTFFFKLFCQSVNISTHSLTKRLTTIFLLFRLCSMYFNSQPHEEADWWRRLSWHWMRYFNSQPHEEADVELWVPWTELWNFNSQPHEEADVSRCS